MKNFVFYCIFLLLPFGLCNTLEDFDSIVRTYRLENYSKIIRFYSNALLQPTILDDGCKKNTAYLRFDLQQKKGIKNVIITDNPIGGVQSIPRGVTVRVVHSLIPPGHQLKAALCTPAYITCIYTFKRQGEEVSEQHLINFLLSSIEATPTPKAYPIVIESFIPQEKVLHAKPLQVIPP